MAAIMTTSGSTIPLDGDLLAILEGIYKELTTRYGLDRTFEDTMREIQHVIDQMREEDRRHYLVESLFLNTVTYENERLGTYMRKLTRR
jgi:hypothetical protein